MIVAKWFVVSRHEEKKNVIWTLLLCAVFVPAYDHFSCTTISKPYLFFNWNVTKVIANCMMYTIQQHRKRINLHIHANAHIFCHCSGPCVYILHIDKAIFYEIKNATIIYLSKLCKCSESVCLLFVYMLVWRNMHCTIE